MNGSFTRRLRKNRVWGDNSAVNPRNRYSVGTGSGIGYREGLPGGKGSDSLRSQARHATSLRDTLPTLDPFCCRFPAHQGLGRCCRRVSPRLRRLRHLGPPSHGSFPEVFAKPATWRPRLVIASSRGVCITNRRLAWAGGLGPSPSRVLLLVLGTGPCRVASLHFFGATGPARHSRPILGSLRGSPNEGCGLCPAPHPGLGSQE